jgi:hypothetical protein
VARAASASAGATRASSLRSACLGCRCARARHMHREKEKGHLSSATCLALSLVHCVPNETWLIQLCAQIFELPAQILSADRPGIFPDADLKSRLLMAQERERDYWQKGDSFARGRAHALFALCSLDRPDVDIASDSFPEAKLLLQI